METREPKVASPEDVVIDVLITVEIVKDRILHVTSRLKTGQHVHHLMVVGCKRATVKVGNLKFSCTKVYLTFLGVLVSQAHL